MSGVLEDPVDKLIAHLKVPADPPRLLYKYLIPERIDVLRNANIRYTQLSGTNDVFEVRRTINTLYGPRMKAALKERFSAMSLEDRIIDRIAKHLDVPEEFARTIFNDRRDTEKMREFLQKLDAELEFQLNEVLPAALGDPEFLLRMQTEFAEKAAALSVSEDPHSPIMWAHYAANWSGFVIAFDSQNHCFRPSPGKGSLFFPIEYRDEMIEELFDNPIGALFSKQTGWGYEREWRRIISHDEADAVIPALPDNILLKSFDRDAVQRVLVGHRPDPGFIDELRVVLRGYPQAGLFQTRTDPVRNMVNEIELQR